MSGKQNKQTNVIKMNENIRLNMNKKVNIEYQKITVMQQEAKLNKDAFKALPADQLPKTESMVKAVSLASASEKEVANKYASLVVKHEGKNYLAQSQSLVPSTAELVRDEQNALVGVPAVVGGSL